MIKIIKSLILLSLYALTVCDCMLKIQLLDSFGFNQDFVLKMNFYQTDPIKVLLQIYLYYNYNQFIFPLKKFNPSRWVAYDLIYLI